MGIAKVILHSFFFLHFCQQCLSKEVNDVYVEDRSYWDRLEDGKSEFICGILLLFLSPMFLWVVEQQVVKYETMISRCRQIVKEVTNNKYVNENLNCRPVLVTGSTEVIETENPVQDLDLGFTATSAVVRLRRVVEMYQWREKKKTENDKTIYSYEAGWHESDLDSSHFRHPSTHENPRRQPHIQSKMINSASVYVGVYHLIERQVQLMNDWTPCTLQSVPTLASRDYSRLHPRIEQSSCYSSTVPVSYVVFNGGSVTNPSVGTVRVSYHRVDAGGDVSTIAVQQGNTFRPFNEEDAHQDACCRCSGLECDCCCCVGCCCGVGEVLGAIAGVTVGNDVLLLEEKLVNIPTMFKNELTALRCRVLMVRLVTYVLLSIGFYLTLHPIAALLSFVPMLGDLLSNVLWVASIIVGFFVGSLVTCCSWIVYRPYMLALLLLGLGIPLWICATTAQDAVVGQLCCGSAVFPIILMCVRLFQYCQFLRHQQELDKRLSQQGNDVPTVYSAVITSSSSDQCTYNNGGGLALATLLPPEDPAPMGKMNERTALLQQHV